MEQTGEYTIAASREEVWQALNDPDILGACITGCQSVEKVDAEHFNVAVKAKIGPVSATFQAELALQDLKPPASYVIEGAVKGGPAGFGKGTAEVMLEEAGPETTLLRYNVKGSVGGKLAQVGSRLVDGAARKMADEFFAEFTQQVSKAAPSIASSESDDAVVSDAESQAAAEAVTDESFEQARDTQVEYEKSGNQLIWVIAFVVLIFAIISAL